MNLIPIFFLISILIISSCNLPELKDEIKDECLSKIKFSEIPESPITDFFLNSEIFSETDVCILKENSKYSWVFDNSKYVYLKSSLPIDGSGNFRGPAWELTVEPYNSNGLNFIKYPFILCSDLSASRYNSWHLSVKNENNILSLRADYARSPAPSPKKDISADELKIVNTKFTNCDDQKFIDISEL